MHKHNSSDLGTEDVNVSPTANRNGNKFVAVCKAPVGLMRGLYNWTIHWSKTKKAPYALFGVAFAESSFFPVPPDALLIPMVVARRERWFWNALICTLGSVAGALLGYLIGYAFYESIGKPVVNAYDLDKAIAEIGEKYSENAFLTVFTAAFTPIPYKVITIGAGFFNVSLLMMVLASSVGRAGRFFLVAGLLRIFGERISVFIEKYFDLLSLAFMALLIGGFVVIKYML